MKIKAMLFVLSLITLFISQGFCETVKVGFEPFPPLINNKYSGYAIDLLKAVEKISDLKFEIKIMPYSRAKKNLETKKIDLMGLTPHSLETKDFYAFAKDLNWKIKTTTDMFGIKKSNIEVTKFRTLNKIGSPFGNKAFMSDVFKIPIESFHEGKLESLLRMLRRGRIDGLIFERASTMSTIKKLKLQGIYYNAIDDTVAASMAVRIDSAGQKLGSKLDKYIKMVDQKKVFSQYLPYIRLPKSGVVK